MIIAKLVKPDTLDVDGKTYAAGEAFPFTKGDAQKMVKAMKKRGISVEVSYEDIGSVVETGRQVDPEKDAQRNASPDSGQSAARRGDGDAGGKQDNRGGSDGNVGALGKKSGRPRGRPRGNA